jgi:hypothetical protein
LQKEFRKELEQSGFLHRLLRPDDRKSVEKRLLSKKAIKQKSLWSDSYKSRWEKRGLGTIEVKDAVLKLEGPFRVEPEKPLEHYSGFGYLEAVLMLGGEDWTEYNRITCRVRSDCRGYHAPYITMNLKNDGATKIPDPYDREGHHIVNLKNHEWDTYVWEFPDLPRDYITEFGISIYLAGREMGGSNDYRIEVGDIYLEKVQKPDHSLGWMNQEESISYSSAGYWPEGRKTAVLQTVANSFTLVDALTREVVFSGELMRIENAKGTCKLADFSEFTREGAYCIKVGDILTDSFPITKNVMEEAAWKVLNYIYSERCGYPVGGGHSSCHGDVIAEHNGLTITFNGGWHDAGDLSQQTLQTGEIVQALFELAEHVKEDTLLYNRIMEEGCWGLDFLLRTRFGDGFRAFSAGLSRWTNGLIGDGDDEAVRCHNRSFDNFLLSGVEASAAKALEEYNRDLSWVVLNAAKEDYGFARRRFDEVGMENCIKMEHTYNASLSQYYAAMCWSAALIYKACKEEYYAAEAEKYAELLISCQDQGEAGLSFRGFFYRDEKKAHIVHFNHQSREHIFMQALSTVLYALKDHAKAAEWEKSLTLYGEYIKAMAEYALPYGMLPAGLHKFDEAEDRETFELLHVATTYEADRENYEKQLQEAEKLNEEYSVRQFPIWFSFRGNSAILLSSGKAAAICGNYLKDQELMEIARDQVYWMCGKNPFSQSLIYGVGNDFAQQYAAHCGETIGEMPVGVQTRENEDVPYWPMANNATYKEIWMTTAGHFLRILADLY